MMNSATAAVARPLFEKNDPLAALINPLSFRMSLHGRAQRCAERVRDHGGQVYMVSHWTEIEQALATILQGPVGRLVIAGGDGTLQATASYLAKALAPDQLPELIVLSGGRTNYVAADVGTRREFSATLERILASESRNLHPTARTSLHLQHPSIGHQHGFFMAGAAVDSVIREVHHLTTKRAGWSNSRAASTLGVTRIGLKWLLGRQRFELPDLKIETDSLGTFDGACRFLLLSTLSQKKRLVRPYARHGRGPLRVTAVRHNARALPLRLPRLLRGHFSPAMNRENGYLSGKCSSVRISNLPSITLDGQEFDLDPNTPLQIDAGPEFRFLRV
ncbi:MAG: diacylglycerol kinase family protein [Wenzhouxiangellaceae bacterium]|nr:diacylglycerol kinase family protein [Wenzhouxiangellaceae bacterium]